ncbi:YtxH domain-containing protein [Streptococcus equi]|uniref:Putative exported protein n=1 Tax=Streptococcus equi subsp. equi (strain 4047) TaxID=553482 RepID=C0M7Z1_STRE4|nr:YtxH domain-containing protein [Streptococcus equi]ASB97155.1 YtxH domain-containing protein [Streptococcus equi subsp. equi]MBT1195468.1 YtxH domain-containing protein [Streptococcus equi subsp. equi]MBT1196693.1 YtxH domain-containing protein [Streptococcus equi subsp. equi]MBT1199438.1 YtxH domain-containing protein [Streptococcus equi subsp. equi]MBT1201275.1 YtxH domain-containing protein [Streptococcus equi subsp. equi]
MSNFFKTLVIGVASGAATAYFLSTEKGKVLKARAQRAYEAYRQNPEEYHQMAKEKGSEYSQLARHTFNDLKTRFESGDMTTDQVFDFIKEKTSQFVHQAKEAASEHDKADDVIIDLDEEDIIINYPEDDSEKEAASNKSEE